METRPGIGKNGMGISDDYFQNPSVSCATFGEDDVELNNLKCDHIYKKDTIILTSKKIFNKSDFAVTSLLGKGAYAKVVKATLTLDNTVKAIKIIEKSFMEKEKKFYQIYLENDILSRLTHPNIIKIEGIFEESDKIYIVLEYLPNGDLYDFITNNSPLHFQTIQFYAAELVLALQYLHGKGVSHRDLKPENIMLDEKFHLKIIDFATAKLKGMIFDREAMAFEEENVYQAKHQAENKDENDDNDNDDDDGPDFEKCRNKRGNTFVGTAEFVSPEVLKDIAAGPEADLWALGCIIYQMFVGASPFKDKSEYLIFKKILEGKVPYPDTILPEAVDLISKLLVPDASKRLGAGIPGEDNDFEALKRHPFFLGVNFDTLTNTVPPKIAEFKAKSGKNEYQDRKNNKQVNLVPGVQCLKSYASTIQILKQDIIEKKSPWFHYNTRKVVLDSTPKIEYIDPEKNIVKGVIYLTRDCIAKYVDNKIFELYTPKRVFKFRTKVFESGVWAKSINDAIEVFAAKR